MVSPILPRLRIGRANAAPPPPWLAEGGGPGSSRHLACMPLPRTASVTVVSKHIVARGAPSPNWPKGRVSPGYLLSDHPPSASDLFCWHNPS